MIGPEEAAEVASFCSFKECRRPRYRHNRGCHDGYVSDVTYLTISLRITGFV